MLKKLGKEKELLDRLKKLHEADPANVVLSYFLAAQYLNAGKLDLAEPIYSELAARTPTMLVYQALAEIYRKGREPDKLLALLGKVTIAAGTLEVLGPEAKPLSSDAALLRSLVEAGRKKAAATVKTDYAEFLALGILAQEQKQYDTANEFFRAGLEGGCLEGVRGAFGLGDRLADRRPDGRSGQVFQRGIDAKAMPDGSPLFQFYLAGALAADEKPDARPKRRADRPPRASPIRPASPAGALRSSFAPGDTRRPAWHMSKLLEKFGGDTESLETALALRECPTRPVGHLCKLGRLDEAEELLEEVLDEYPDDIEADNDLGFLWADGNKHLARALEMIRTAVAAEPDNRAYRDSLGWVYYRLGRFAEAVAELEKAPTRSGPTARSSTTWATPTPSSARPTRPSPPGGGRRRLTRRKRRQIRRGRWTRS